MPPVQPTSWILACEVTRCGGDALRGERKQRAMKVKAHKTRGADAFEASRTQEALVRSKDPFNIDVGVESEGDEYSEVALGGSIDGKAAARAYNPIAASAAAYGDASAAGDGGAESATAIAAAAAADARDERAATSRSALPGAAVLSTADLAVLHQFVEYPHDRTGALLGEVRELLCSRLGIARALLRSSTKAKLVPLAIYLQHTPLERFLIVIGRFTTFSALSVMMDEDVVNTAIVELQETSKTAEGGSAEFARLSITSLQGECHVVCIVRVLVVLFLFFKETVTSFSFAHFCCLLLHLQRCASTPRSSSFASPSTTHTR